MGFAEVWPELIGMLANDPRVAHVSVDHEIFMLLDRRLSLLPFRSSGSSREVARIGANTVHKRAPELVAIVDVRAWTF
jgi:hypothetical protein